MVDEFPQAQVPGEGGRQEQAGIGHQAVIVKGDADTVGIVLVAASIGCSFFPGGFLFQTIIPRFRGAPSGCFKGCPQGRPSVDSGLGEMYAENLNGQRLQQRCQGILVILETERDPGVFPGPLCITG